MDAQQWAAPIKVILFSTISDVLTQSNFYVDQHHEYQCVILRIQSLKVCIHSSVSIILVSEYAM